ncbi:MAG: histone deacetylase [Candidatus Eisenbacteria bacterium]
MQCTVHYVHEPLAYIDIGPHVFPTEKYDLIAEALRRDLGVEKARIHGWEALTEADLARVHTPQYLSDLYHARISPATESSELPVTQTIIQGFQRMAGGSLAAARLARRHGVGFHVGGGFHHAFADHAEGFCYVHDMAIAIEHLRVKEGLGRVLFVDVDVHQGNGTAAIYANDHETFTYSIHQENNYPVKETSDLDRGLDDGIGDEEYLACLREDLERIDQSFAPELVCYVAGVDPHMDDMLGGLALTESGILERDRLVLSRFVGRGISVAVFLAGGYSPSPEQTARLHVGTARAAEEACRVR